MDKRQGFSKRLIYKCEALNWPFFMIGLGNDI